ncbi:MAG: GGDEF domain-containing protein [Myxococcaceae bacterium]|nr:GGDEF domain-containing protein [Myxococcaceae bacterium]
MTRARLLGDPFRRVRSLERALAEATAELETLRSLAYRDPLTGLHNRRAFEQRLSEELSRARRAKGCFSLLVVDLDDFKLINDTRGHQVGDLVLRSVASALVETFREHDVVCRTGGDEFMVILPDATRANLGSALARLERRLAVADCGFPVVASIGAASYAVDGRTCEELITHADRQMYELKRRRKACGPEYARSAVSMRVVHGEETQT